MEKNVKDMLYFISILILVFILFFPFNKQIEYINTFEPILKTYSINVFNDSEISPYEEGALKIDILGINVKFSYVEKEEYKEKMKEYRKFNVL